jgi:4-hydroxy-tetrahydrodipicolinate synthase
VTAPLQGIIPILATPFDESGAVALADLKRLVDFELSAGAAGVAVFGMASEGFTLTTSERADIVQVTRAQVGARIPVVTGVSATSTAIAVEQGQHSVDNGADALMVLPPHLVKPSADQLIDFFGTVASACQVPVMIQDAPGATGVSMPTPVLRELAKLDGVDYVKVEAPPTAVKVGAVAETAPGLTVFGGQNALFVLEERARGAAGTMPACEFTDLLAHILGRWDAGDAESARDGFDRLLPLIRFGMQPGIAYAIHKEVLVLRGIIGSAVVRSPAAPLDARSRADLLAILRRLPELRTR